ncbi:unnamed protein product [Allacma fusca]|uniref:Uncharacterized protein n=1 Tax=Allacma fusca TaxID=39272 RepID=A0A8J2KS13_9HEXA|nr:unnamed protein product [Allacma fusca]
MLTLTQDTKQVCLQLTSSSPAGNQTPRGFQIERERNRRQSWGLAAESDHTLRGINNKSSEEQKAGGDYASN